MQFFKSSTLQGGFMKKKLFYYIQFELEFASRYRHMQTLEYAPSNKLKT